MAIFVEGDRIILEKHRDVCALCGSTEDVSEVKGRPICADVRRGRSRRRSDVAPRPRPTVTRVDGVAPHARSPPRRALTASFAAHARRRHASATMRRISSGSGTAGACSRPGGPDQQDDLALELALGHLARRARSTGPRATSSYSFVSSRAIAALAPGHDLGDDGERRGGAARRLVEDERRVQVAQPLERPAPLARLPRQEAAEVEGVRGQPARDERGDDRRGPGQHLDRAAPRRGRRPRGARRGPRRRACRRPRRARRVSPARDARHDRGRARVEVRARGTPRAACGCRSARAACGSRACPRPRSRRRRAARRARAASRRRGCRSASRRRAGVPARLTARSAARRRPRRAASGRGRRGGGSGAGGAGGAARRRPGVGGGGGARRHGRAAAARSRGGGGGG